MALDPEAAVRNIHLYSAEEFHAAWASVRDFVIVETLDDGGRPQGHAILRVTQAYQCDDDGAFAKATYLGCSDEYYQYWVDNDMRPGTFHHFCRANTLKTCRGKVGRDGIIHVLRWCTISKQEGEALMRHWGLSPVLMSRKVQPVPAGVGPSGGGAPASKSAPARPPHSLARDTTPGDRERSPILRRSRRTSQRSPNRDEA